MELERIRELVARHATVSEGEQVMVVAIVERSYLDEMSEDEFCEQIAGITFTMKPSTPWDDDTYWTAQSPFDDQWYLFVAGSGGGMPTEPVEVSLDYPSVMLED